MIADKLGIFENTAYLICGPPPMVKYACLDNLKNLSVTDEQIIIF